MKEIVVFGVKCRPVGAGTWVSDVAYLPNGTPCRWCITRGEQLVRLWRAALMDADLERCYAVESRSTVVDAFRAVVRRVGGNEDAEGLV